MQIEDLKLILVDPLVELCDEWQQRFDGLSTVSQHNNSDHARKIRTLACPGLGTATGKVPFHRAAKQMALAYKNFFNPPDFISWPYEIRRQKAIGAGGDPQE